MSHKEHIYSVDGDDIQMYSSITVAQNEPMLNQIMNRSVGELDYNDKQLHELNKLVFSQLNISEYNKGHAYNVGDLVWYKDSLHNIYLLRCIQQNNTTEPDTHDMDGLQFSKLGDSTLLASGWENQNKHLTILDYGIMNLVSADAMNVVIQHEDDPLMHPFGRLDRDLNDIFLQSSLSNIDINRKSVFFPMYVERLESGIAIATGYCRNFGKIIEYDIILKLASDTTQSFASLFEDMHPLSANNTMFQLFSGVSQSSMQFQTNKNYFSNTIDMDIFAPESDGVSRCGIIVQHNRNDYVNTYTAKVTFPYQFIDLNYMVFSNQILSQTIGSHTMVPSANEISYCDKTRQSITFIDITFPDSTKYGVPGYNAKNGGLVANSFHMKVIGQIGE